jgi:Ser/Thr protein kinase RdoA (MazF antagonist)
MRLSTLWKVDREITADGRNPIAEEVARRWRHDPASVRFFRSSANFVYTLGADRGYFLRFAHESERSRDAIEAELRLLSLLAQTDAPVAVPVASRAGKLVETVATGSGTFHACVFPARPGRQLEFDALDLSQFGSWGLALGGLHAAMSSCVDAPLAGRPSWNERMRSRRPRARSPPVRARRASRHEQELRPCPRRLRARQCLLERRSDRGNRRLRRLRS